MIGFGVMFAVLVEYDCKCELVEFNQFVRYDYFPPSGKNKHDWYIDNIASTDDEGKVKPANDNLSWMAFSDQTADRCQAVWVDSPNRHPLIGDEELGTADGQFPPYHSERYYDDDLKEWIIHEYSVIEWSYKASAKVRRRKDCPPPEGPCEDQSMEIQWKVKFYWIKDEKGKPRAGGSAHRVLEK